MTKKEIIIYTIGVLVAAIVLFLTQGIPEIKKELGSSDHILTTLSAKKLIDIKIDDTLYGLELDDDNKVVNVIFYNESSLILYNKNIEKKSLSTAIDLSYKLLEERNKITNKKIMITKYDDKSYKEYFNNINYSSYKEIKSSYEELNNKYNLNSTEDTILSNLNIYSKDYVLYFKNINVIDYTDYVYKKLLIYQANNNIKDESKDNHSLDIKTIKIKGLSNYPTNNSYYYIKDKKVYAYIEVTVNNLDIGSCYKGNLKAYKKGKC